MSEWFSAQKLAGLPGLPGTVQGINSRAIRDSWQQRKHMGRGGGREYHISSLPEETRAALLNAALGEVATKVVRQETQLALVESNRQQLVADARQGVLHALDLMMARTGYSRKRSITLMLDMARLGQVEPQLLAMLKMARDPRGRPSADGLPSVRSLERFLDQAERGALVPKVRRPDMSVPDWAPAFMTIYQGPEKRSARAAHALLEKHWQGQMPSLDQVYAFLRKVGNVSREVGRMGEHEIKALRPFIRRDFTKLLPTDVYSCDGHTFDAEVQHPMHGRPFRPEITTIIDIRTRRIPGWSTGLAESALVVVDALRDACTKGGIPAIFYVDNGSGYVNHMMRDEAVGLMGRLGIDMKNSLPYNSQARGVIERVHQSLWIRAAKELPGYIGADMDRQAKLATFKLTRRAIAKGGTMPLMSWESFVAFCEQQIAEYNDRPHSSLPRIVDPNTGRRRHMTPNEAWALHEADGFSPMRVTDDEARPLFRPQVLRTVRRCELEFIGNRYFARELEEFHGDQVAVGYDIHDASRVWVYDGEGRFLCTAELNGNSRDYMPASYVERAREKRAEAREKRALAHLDEIRAERDGGYALEMDAPLSIPGLGTITPEQLRSRSAATLEMQAERIDEPRPAAATAQATTAQVFTLPTAPAQRYRQWCELAERQRSGQPIEPDAAQWFEVYPKSKEFAAQQRQA
ncbi:DNA-binding protein [Pseudomonas aeruginosa]|uniref:DNA-binding protein n=1 Tax=Pseudomonas aeruginosa TaxID=287 RepID=UPI00273A2B90|nr:DNA-binding protein [Pseudomonas aeruginosa]